jgi:hypothetical protein
MIQVPFGGVSAPGAHIDETASSEDGQKYEFLEMLVNAGPI